MKKIDVTLEELLEILESENHQIQYAVFAAESVLYIYMKKYPGDNRPQKAIEAAKRWLENPTKENRQAADAYAADAYAASAAASADGDAAYYAADDADEAADAYAAAADGDAAYAAANAAAAAAAAADGDAADAIAAAAAAAAYDAKDTKTELMIRILEYGLSLILQ